MTERAMTADGTNLLPITSSPFEATRRLLLRLNDLGIAITSAMDDAGVGGWSSNVDLAALGVVASSGRVRPRDLLAPTRLTRGGLSNLLDRLESAQLVTRTYGEVAGDRRGAIVTITPQGHALVEDVATAAAQAVDEQRNAILDMSDSLDALGVPRATNATTHPPSPLELLTLIGDLGTMMVDALASVDPDDPTPTKTAIVLCLCGGPGPTRPRGLIQPTQLSSGGVSQLLDRLEQATLIHRRSGGRTDRRSVIIEPTSLGTRLHQRHLTAVREQLAEARPILDSFAARTAAPRSSKRR